MFALPRYCSGHPGASMQSLAGDTFVDLYRNTHLSVQVDVANNLTLDNST